MSVTDVNIPSQIIVQTTAQWASDAVVYGEKTILVTSDEYYAGTNVRKLKIPNGADTWSALDYLPVGTAGAVSFLSITGDPYDNTNLADALDLKADESDLQQEITDRTTADTAVLNSAKTYAEGLVVGLWDDRGGYDPATNAYPTTGGSSTAGAILKGDIWTISVAGFIGQAVQVGDTVRALVDSPGQTVSNWTIAETNIGYVPENVVNKVQDFTDPTSTTKYPSIKAVVDYITSLAYVTAAYVTSALASFKTANFLDATSSIQTQIDSRVRILATTCQDSSPAVTGNTNNTLVYSYMVPANTMTPNTILAWLTRYKKTGTASTLTVRYYWNTSAGLGGATLMGNFAASANILGFERIFAVKTNTTTEAHTTSVSTAIDRNSNLSQFSTILTMDWTTNVYLIATIQNAAAGDSSILTMSNILKQ